MELNRFLEERFMTSGKLAVLGVGSFLKADDAAGSLIAERLKTSFEGMRLKSTAIYTGESAPENYTGVIKKFKPDCLLVLDAADLRKSPGSLGCIGADTVGGITFCTHMLPVSIMLEYLRKETGCLIDIIGIQPGNLAYLGPMTVSVAKTVDYVTLALKLFISRFEHMVAVSRITQSTIEI